jgi:hypothetical protein
VSAWAKSGSRRRERHTGRGFQPDGRQADRFLSDRSREWEFYVMDADGSNRRKILENVTEQLDIFYTGGNERVLSWGR